MIRIYETTTWYWFCPKCHYRNEESDNPDLSRDELVCFKCGSTFKEFEHDPDFEEENPHHTLNQHYNRGKV